MSKLLSEIQQWIEFAKGAQPGHVFEGNQYTKGDAPENVKDAIDTLYDGSDGMDPSGDDQRAHELLGRFHAQRASETTGDVSKLHANASVKHFDAAKTYPAQFDSPEHEEKATKAQTSAIKASKNAFAKDGMDTGTFYWIAGHRDLLD
jgi:hypothetical protein